MLHRDDDLLVVDKPSGLLSVPGKPESHRDCLEARVRAAFPAALTVHRLDLATSGVTVFALTARAQRHLGLQFERRRLRKTYLARVMGRVGQASGRIALPLAADWPRRPRQKVCHDTGRPAATRWRRVGVEEGASRLVVRPFTGRSHQIRVHLAAIGHPILGDPFYAPPEAWAPRLQLHALALALRHPADGAWRCWRAPAPF
ncbi:MAG: pseudouridine synthase [Paracoccaceae bacterium]